MPIVIAVALDGRYAPWAAVLLQSCVRANPTASISFEIVHDGSLSQENCGHLERIATARSAAVRFHCVAGDRFSDLPTTPRFGSIVWLRFCLPELLSDQSRILYLDSDTLVLSDLHALWDTALDPYPLAAVANVVEPSATSHVKALGIRYPGGLFNSGVLLMDLARMRTERSSEQLFRAAAVRRHDAIWPDQDALNVVFANRWLSLHPRWNTQNSFWALREQATEVFGARALREATRRPAIRHFEGPGLSKPWHYLCPYPGRDEYRGLLAETPWAHLPLEDRTAATWFVRLFPRDMRYRAYGRLLQARSRRSVAS